MNEKQNKSKKPLFAADYAKLANTFGKAGVLAYVQLPNMTMQFVLAPDGVRIVTTDSKRSRLVRYIPEQERWEISTDNEAKPKSWLALPVTKKDDYKKVVALAKEELLK